MYKTSIEMFSPMSRKYEGSGESDADLFENNKPRKARNSSRNFFGPPTGAIDMVADV